MHIFGFVFELILYISAQFFSMTVVGVFFFKSGLMHQTSPLLFLMGIPFILIVAFISTHFGVETFIELLKNTKIARKHRNKVYVREACKNLL